MAAFTFRKEERLKRKKQIDRLFAAGKSFYLFPFKIFWLMAEEPQPAPAKVLIGVSRRSMRKAVNRNRAKRLIREAYRLQKNKLYQHLAERSLQVHIGIIFTGHELLTFEQTEEKINLVVARLLKEIHKANT